LIGWSEGGQDTRSRFVERIVPDETTRMLLKEHRERYRFASNLVPGRTVLDAACGVGYGLAILVESAASRVIGLDSSLGALQIAKGERVDERIAIVRGDVRRRPIKSEVIDVVVSLETIEHVDHPERCLSEFRRVLRERGCAVISTPNRSLVSPMSETPKNPHHVKEFTVSEFDALLRNAFPSVSLYGQAPRGNRRDLDAFYRISYVLHRLGFHTLLEPIRELLQPWLSSNKNHGLQWLGALLQCPILVSPLAETSDFAPAYLTGRCDKTP